MMKQRRRLMSQQMGIEKVFSTAAFVTCYGNDCTTNVPVYLEKSRLLSNQKQYIFAYICDTMAIFTYYNGTVNKIFEAGTIYPPLSWYDNTARLRLDLYSKGANVYSYSHGSDVLTFDLDADNVFSNLFDISTEGGIYVTAQNITLTLADYVSKYLFIGSGDRFCVYKVNGATFADITAIYNLGLYLINYGDTKVKISSGYLTALNTHGYTVLSAKG